MKWTLRITDPHGDPRSPYDIPLIDDYVAEKYLRAYLFSDQWTLDRVEEDQIVFVNRALGLEAAFEVGP